MEPEVRQPSALCRICQILEPIQSCLLLLVGIPQLRVNSSLRENDIPTQSRCLGPQRIFKFLFCPRFDNMMGKVTRRSFLLSH